MSAYHKETKRGSHLTVIKDDTVEKIAETLGFTALGIYTLLERRVDRNGKTVVSYQYLADCGKMSRRQVIRVVSQLVDAGFVIANGRSGNMGIELFLPAHIQGGDKGGDKGGDNGGVSPITTVITEVVDQRSSQGSRSSRGTKLPDLTPDEEQVWFDEAVRLGIAEERVLWVVAQFRDYWRANGGRKVDWLSAWRTWCRNELQWRDERGSRGERARKAAGAESVAEALDRRRAQRLGGE